MPKRKTKPPTRLDFETYHDIECYFVLQLKDADSPRCVNGTVNYRRHRVTVELIDEPIEVLRARLNKMYRESDNMHHRRSIAEEAHRLGFNLDISGRLV